MHGAPKCARAAMRPWSGVARPTASPGPETMPGCLAFSMTCRVTCEQRASPTLPQPQLTTLAHQKHSSLAPSRDAFPAGASCLHYKKNTLPWWYVFVIVGHFFCHACTSMTNLWQNQDSHTCAVIEVFHDITKIIITEVSTSMTINRAS